MTKTKYLLYAFKYQQDKKYTYWYETDNKFFQSTKPLKSILDKNPREIDNLNSEDIIENPWEEWNSNDIQKIIASNGVSINYLKSTEHDFIQTLEDKKLLEMYVYLVDNFDISKSFGFNTVIKWHKEIFKTIYPFAGDLRTVEMGKGTGSEAWTWQLTFLNGIPALDKLIKEVSSRDYEDIDSFTQDLSKVICDFLFIHPFREGNGRLSRLLCDILLAKNGFPMIGLNLKSGDKYIERIHEGYQCNYEPMSELLKIKIEEEITNE
ncbi:Fic/DOC family protein [Aliarcobacter cryaerophilus]|uniref:Fic/DOC family protein n=1 Tax=Aliarcobacter cryaerophilus TaxID=28198 RepID=UPI003BB0F6C2